MKFIKRTIVIVVFLVGLLWIYTNSLIRVDPQAKLFLKQLKEELNKSGYRSNYFVISGRRWKLDNYLLVKLGGAAPNSQHLKGQAIDIIVLDVNQDGKQDVNDVNIVYKILDDKIIKDNGGLGSYQNEKGFFNRQMIHFDHRGKRARWKR